MINDKTEWRPTAPLLHLQARAAALAAVRQFFAQRHVLEVETPYLSQFMNTDPNIESWQATFGGQTSYLHTSPEFPMKRLVAAGYGAIYQICRVFRAVESGRRHNPEFTMVEWYRPGFDDAQLMAEVFALVQTLCPAVTRLDLTYRSAFLQYAEFDPFAISLAELQARAQAVLGWQSTVRDEMLDLWLAQVVEPALPHAQLVFITEWPPSMAALARVSLDAQQQPVARRFEAFYCGMEIANGYYELIQADEQQRRFEADLHQRTTAGQPVAPYDRHLVAALAAGLPDCAGVALGFDRLIMALTGAQHINEVLSFPIERT